MDRPHVSLCALTLAVALAGCAGSGELSVDEAAAPDGGEAVDDAAAPPTDALAAGDGAEPDAGEAPDADGAAPDAAHVAPDAATPDAAPPDAAPPDAAPPDAAVPDAGPPPACVPSRQACDDDTRCCGDLMCGRTTLGRVCCGGDGASCATPNGEDCCGDLLCVGGRCQPAGAGAPDFQAPYACGQRWTYSHHAAEVRRALDFVRADGGPTDDEPTLASAAGVARRRQEPGGAGNYIVIDHGDGWQTYHFHLSDFLVPDGAWVAQGQPVGLVGSTGASSGPHLHYEQLRHGAGQVVAIDGDSLAPYPGRYFERDLVSRNACDGPRPYMTWGADRPVHEAPSLDARVLVTLRGPTPILVVCQRRGQVVDAEGYTNDWWSLLRDQGGWLSNIYIDDPAARLPDVPECE